MEDGRMKWLQSKEPTEMEQIMENITKLEVEIQQKFFQLGQLYYEDHKENGNPEENYGTIIDSIRKLDLNRKEFYKNKLRLEGQMLCESCGAIIPYGSVYCNICGKKADEKQGRESVKMSASVEKCKMCGAELETGSLFCTSCGSKVE